MKLVILHEASEELSDAAAWYESEQVGLGADLLAEAARVVRKIAESPTTWPLAPRSRGVRRFLFVRFPYVAYYVIQGDAVRVVAFGHTSRRPGYWRDRLRK